MNPQGASSSHSPAGLSRGQRLIAFVLLVLVAFFVVNPMWECHDQMDNLRHLGSNGFLETFLVVACAGIALTSALRWVGLKNLPIFLVSLRSCVIHRLVPEKPFNLFEGGLPSPLRI